MKEKGINKFTNWHFRPNTQDEFIYNEVYVNNCYRLPDDLSGKVIVDIGANIGAFTIACLDRGAEAVYAYEPDPRNFELLQLHVLAHQQKNIVYLSNRFVVGGQREQGDILVPSEYQRHSNTALTGGVIAFNGTTSEGEISVDRVGTIRISDFFSQVYLDSRYELWLKLDCEGSEYQILSSSLPWDRIDRIFGEIHHYKDGKFSRDTERIDRSAVDFGTLDGSRDSLLSHLESVGYKLETESNPQDDRLTLFWAFKAKESRMEGTCPACGKPQLSIAPCLYCAVQNQAEAWKEIEEAIPAREMKTVAVLTPFRNARKYLSLYFSQMVDLRTVLCKEGYTLRLVAAEGDSLDGTRERLVELAEQSGFDLTLVDTTHGHMRWASVEDPVRMRVMSEVMNKALGEVQQGLDCSCLVSGHITDDNLPYQRPIALYGKKGFIVNRDCATCGGSGHISGDDILVWIMSDLQWEPVDLAQMVIAAFERREGFDIFAPLALCSRTSDKGPDRFYDTWAFRGLDGKRFQPEFPWHSSLFNDFDEIQSAGSCLVMRAEIAKQCRATDQEAVSFCAGARSKGYRIAISPGLSVYHAPLPAKRLLWISDAVCISGFSRVAHAMFPLLVEAGYDLDIIALNYWGEPHNFPYNIYPANVQGDDPSGNLRAQHLVYQAEKQERPYDLIVKLDDPWNVKGLLIALENLQERYSIDPPPVLPWVTVDGYNIQGEDFHSVLIPSILSCSQFGKEQLVSGGSGDWPVHLVPFGVDTQIFQPLDKTEARSLVSSKDIPLDAFIVGTVSTNQLRKRLDLVLAYFADWIKHFNVENAYLYLCLGPEDNSGCDIKSLVRYYGLQSRIILNTSLLTDPAMALVYNSFDVFISLSQGEGFGLPALEAMACGVPCVVTDWAAYGSWVPETAAYKVPCTSTALSSPLNTQAYVVGGVADREATVGALQKLYMYPELREQMGRAGMEFAQGMTWKQAGDRLLEEIERVLAQVGKDEHACDPSEGCGVIA